jgi:hypothetical protein
MEYKQVKKRTKQIDRMIEQKDNIVDEYYLRKCEKMSDGELKKEITKYLREYIPSTPAIDIQFNPVLLVFAMRDNKDKYQQKEYILNPEGNSVDYASSLIDALADIVAVDYRAMRNVVSGADLSIYLIARHF